MNSAKILSLELPNIKFIDSMNFFPMALSNFPKTFGLNEMKKGFFPHFFNIQQNQIYEGYMPDKSYYDPDGMSPQEKKNSTNGTTRKYPKDKFLISSTNCWRTANPM